MVGELAQGLHQEGGGAHGGLADPKLEDRVRLVGADVLEPFLQGLTDQGLGKHRRGVVGGAVDPVDAIQVEDELAGPVDAWLLRTGLDDDLALLELFKTRLGHEPRWGSWGRWCRR